MDNDRANNAVDAFRSAEAALAELIKNANELTDSATSLRETDQDVRTLAEALGIASKQWADIAASMKDVSAEVQAAATLLRKAEPQELHDAVDENTTSIGELRTMAAANQESLESLNSTTALLIDRVQSIVDMSTSLRDAVVAKLDLLQSSTTQVQAELARSFADAQASQEKTRRAIEDAAGRLERELAASSASSQSASKINLIVISLAAAFALAAVVLQLVR